MNVVGFDIETELIPDDWDRKTPLDITCAAVYARIETESGLAIAQRIWFAGMSNSPSFDSINAQIDAIERVEVEVTSKMTEAEIDRMFTELSEYVSGEYLRNQSMKRVGNPSVLITWNGVGFDFPVIAAALPDRKQEIVNLCAKSLDPCFQFIRQFGFPISLKAVAGDMLGEEKFEGMTGEDATLWPLDAGKILRYCLKDAELTTDVVETIRAEGQVRWTTKAGKQTGKSIPKNRWLTVNGAMKLKEPDRSWMKDYDGTFDLERMRAWMK